MRRTAILLCMLAQAALPQTGRPRARDLGLKPGVFPPGPLNAITDVAGVKVGHVTLVEGDTVHTGVTAILPGDWNLFREKVPGAVFVGNAFGKLAGSTQVEELGTIETPIVLTNTLNVGTAMEGVIAYTLAFPGNEHVASVNALVGETNDGLLNDIRGMHVQREDVIAAIRGARGGPVPEGSVGAGTGTMCFGWKGGIGTSSRAARRSYGGYTVGVLVQTNFGGVLTMGGAPVGRELGKLRLRGRGSRRRLLHDRGGDRRSADGTGPQAPGGARGFRAGAHRLVLQQRQRRFCHCLLDRSGRADPHRRRGTGDLPGAPGRRASRPYSKWCSKRPRKQSTTRCYRRLPCIRGSAQERPSRSTGCARF